MALGAIRLRKNSSGPFNLQYGFDLEINESSSIRSKAFEATLPFNRRGLLSLRDRWIRLIVFSLSVRF